MFYLSDAVASGSNHLSLQDGGTPPAVSTTATGWTINTLAAGYSARMAAGVERAAAVFQNAVSEPNGAPDNTIGDCFRSPSLNRTFNAGNWILNIPVIAVSSGWVGPLNMSGLINFRLWKSANADGSGGTNITAPIGLQQTSVCLNLLTSAQQILTKTTLSLASFTLTNEYLFLQIAWNVADNENIAADRDVLIRIGPDATLSEPGAITPRNASIAAELPSVTFSSAATFAPSRAANITATLPNVAMTISGDTGVPEFDADIVSDLPNIAFVVTGDTAPPEYEASIITTLPNITLALAGAHVPPEYNADIIATLPNVVFASNAFIGNPVWSASIDAELPSAAIVIDSTTEVPEYTANLVADLPRVTIALNAIRTLPEYTAAILATLPSIQFSASGDTAYPTIWIDTICITATENDIEFEIAENDLLVSAQQIECTSAFRASGSLVISQPLMPTYTANITATLPNVEISLSADVALSFGAEIVATLPSVIAEIAVDTIEAINYSQTQAGNYSDPLTWGGVGPPNLSGGDTAEQNFNLTIDVDAVIGTSPNDTTTISWKRNAGVLTIAPDVTFEIRGKFDEAFTFANDYTLILNSGSHIHFNPTLSGGNPEYIWYNTFNSFKCQATVENPAIISAPDGCKWKWQNTSLLPKLDVQHLILRNLDTADITLNPAVTQIKFEYVRIENAGTYFTFVHSASNIDVTLRHIKITGSYSLVFGGVWDEVAVWDISDTAIGEVWQPNFNNAANHPTRGIIAHHIMVKGNYAPVPGTGRFKEFRNSFIRSLSDSLYFWDTDPHDNFFYGYAPGPNFHHMNAYAITREIEVRNNFFELDVGNEAFDNGDWIFPVDEFGFGVNVHHNILTHNTRAGSVGTTMSVTIYFAQPDRRSRFWNNTLPCDWAVGQAGCAHLGEGGSDHPDMIEVWKDNLCYSNGTNPGYMVMRLPGAVTPGIMTAAGANGNATVGLLAGNNGRSYHDAQAPTEIKSLFNNDPADGTNAATAGVDNIRLVDVPPQFRGINRDLKPWGAMKGFGIVPEDIMDELFEDTSLIDELLSWCVEGRTPQNIAYLNAGVSSTPGAVEYAPAP